MEIKEFDPMPVPLALGWLFYLVGYPTGRAA